MIIQIRILAQFCKKNFLNNCVEKSLLLLKNHDCDTSTISLWLRDVWMTEFWKLFSNFRALCQSMHDFSCIVEITIATTTPTMLQYDIYHVFQLQNISHSRYPISCHHGDSTIVRGNCNVTPPCLRHPWHRESTEGHWPISDSHLLPGPLLPIWCNFNHSMDRKLHPLQCVSCYSIYSQTLTV